MIESEISIIYSGKPTQEEAAFLTNRLSEIACNIKKMPPIEEYSFLVFKNQEIMGGIYGYMYYGCLYIDELWLHKDLREQGIGSKLMNAAEKLAVEKNCLFSTVNTMDLEAKDFYLKLGYELEFERKGYLHNSTMYLFRKNFGSINRTNDYRNENG